MEFGKDSFEFKSETSTVASETGVVLNVLILIILQIKKIV